MTAAFTPGERNTLGWVERNRNGGRPLHDGQARCALVLCSIAAPYNLQTVGRWQINHWGIRVRYCANLATFDGDEVTRLVLAAHQHCVRVQLSPGKPFVPKAPPLREFSVRGGLVVETRRTALGGVEVLVVWKRPVPNEWLDVSDPRVIVGPSSGHYDDRWSGPTMNIATHWRTPGAASGFQRHPTLDDLATRAARLAVAERWTRLGAAQVAHDDFEVRWEWPDGGSVSKWSDDFWMVMWLGDDRVFDSETEAFEFVAACHLAAAGVES